MFKTEQKILMPRPRRGMAFAAVAALSALSSPAFAQSRDGDLDRMTVEYNRDVQEIVHDLREDIRGSGRGAGPRLVAELAFRTNRVTPSCQYNPRNPLRRLPTGEQLIGTDLRLGIFSGRYSDDADLMEDARRDFERACANVHDRGAQLAEEVVEWRLENARNK